MRIPADLPRRRRRERVSSRWRALLVVLAVALFLLATSLRGIAGFYTDYLWFDSLGFSGVFTGVLGAKVVLGAIFTAVFLVLLWGNLLIADRLAPRFRAPGPEEEVIERYRELVGERTGLVRFAVSLLFAVIAGVGVSGQWDAWILFTNSQEVGADDAQFGTDIGFFLFRLPFLTFVVDWAFASLVIVLIVTAVAHYLNGGIRVSGPGQRVTPAVKGHLSVLLGVLAVLRAVGYWLARYELDFSTRGTVRGATYTDVNAQLPALNLLILISLAAFVLLIVNIWRRGWVLPVLAVGLWAFTAVVVGGIYPAIVQRFSVEPSESAKEREYIGRNIEATRAALNMESVDEQPFEANADIPADALEANAATVRNIRLWDPKVLTRTYQRLQEGATYYNISDVDVDRYQIDGELTQVVLSARELETSRLPQQSWEARHLSYTSGYGVALSAANGATADGEPDVLVGDVPAETTPDLPLDQPSIYVGEGLTEYVITNTDRTEIAFQTDEGTSERTSYEGEDGVGIGGFLRKAAFSLRFGDVNPLISANLRGDSKILYLRDVRERVEALAPFLHFDADPYPVLLEDGLVWVVDAYTTSSHYPYAQGADTDQLPDDSGLDHGFSYVRNSVKAVIDAYDGTVTFYVVDDRDVLVQAYREAFPELFTDGDEVPDELRAHFRYPEDLFRVQTNMWGRYHLDDPDDFYDQSTAWTVAQDPGTAGAAASQQIDENTGQPVGPAREARIEPYYQVLQLPGEDEESFVVVRPFVPFSEDDRRQELRAFMVADSDPEEYGRLRTYVVRGNPNAPGPKIVQADIQSDTAVSEQETLLGSGNAGSQVDYGNLLLIPVEQALLYVRPFYVVADSSDIPLLRKVIVATESDVVIEDTLEQALTTLFGSSPPTLEADRPDGTAEGPPDDGEGPGTPEDPPPDEELAGDVAELLADAEAAFDAASTALEDGNLAEYQEQVDRAADLVRRARELEGSASGSTSGDDSTTTTSTTSTTEPASA